MKYEKYENLKKFKLIKNSKVPNPNDTVERRKKSQTVYETEFDNTSFNLGSFTGKAGGITVVDLDFYDKKDKHFDRSSSLFLKTFSEDFIKHFNTFTVESRPGGYHLYFLYNSKIPNKVNNEHRIDILNDDKYIVCPHSIKDGILSKIVNNVDIKPMSTELEQFILNNLVKDEEEVEEGKGKENKRKVKEAYVKVNKSNEHVYQYNLANFNNIELKKIVSKLNDSHWKGYKNFLNYTCAFKELTTYNANFKTLWDEINQTKPNYDSENNERIWSACVNLPESVQQIFGVDFTGFTKYRPTLKNEIKADRTINKTKLGFEFFNIFDNFVIKSDTGTGKTTSFMHYAKNNNLKFISLVSRVSLGEAQYTSFSTHGIECKFFKLDRYEEDCNYICTIDSVLKFAEQIKISEYVIFLDEYNSLIEYLCTSETLKNLRAIIYPILCGLMQNCKQFICTDADISDTSLIFLKQNKNIKPFQYVVNSHLHNRDIQAQEIFDFQVFCNELKTLNEFLICTDSKKGANKIYLELGGKQSKIKLITSDITEADINGVNLDEHAKVIFSPKILYGLDSIRKRPVYAFFKEKTISPTAMIQQICRARNMTTLKFIFQKKSFNYNDITFDEVKNKMIEMNTFSCKIFNLTHNIDYTKEKENKLYDSYLHIASRFQFNKLCYETNKYSHFLSLLDQRGFLRKNEIKKTDTSVERKLSKELKESLEENFEKEDEYVVKINQFFKIPDDKIDDHKEFFVETHLRSEHLNVCCYLDNSVEDILSSVKKLDDYDVNKLQSSKMKIQFILKLKNKTGCEDAVDVMCKKELSSKKKVEYLEEYKNLSLRYQGKNQLTFDTIESTQKILIKLMRDVLGNTFIKSKQYGNPKKMKYWIDQESIDHHRLIQSYRQKKKENKKKMFKPIDKLHDDILIQKAK